MTKRDYEEFEPSNSLLNNVPALRKRLQEKGYLFFRDVLDKSQLLRIREDVLALAERHGIVAPGTKIADGIYSGEGGNASAKFETSKLYREILELESFNRFGRNPVLSLLYSGLLDGEILEHRRRIGRITFPGSLKQTTPAHQDYFYIRGSLDTFTNWIPAGDCPQELGGLAVLEGSNHCGFLQHTPMDGTGGHGLTQEVCDSLGLRWLSTNFKTGDLLLFHSMTVHKALPNVTSDRLRVSLEYRVQRSGDPIDPGSTVYHMKGAFGAYESLV